MRTTEQMKGFFWLSADFCDWPLAVIEEISKLAEGGDLVVCPPIARLVGPPGTAMFANTELCLHRAGIPQPGHVRDIMEFTFLPAREPLSSDWWAHD